MTTPNPATAPQALVAFAPARLDPAHPVVLHHAASLAALADNAGSHAATPPLLLLAPLLSTPDPDPQPHAAPSALPFGEALATHTNPPADLLTHARPAADRAVAHLRAALPTLFLHVGPALAPTLTARLTYRIAYRHLPTLIAAARRLAPYPGPVTLLDAPFSPDTAHDLLARVNAPPLAPRPLHAASTTTPEDSARLAKRFARLALPKNTPALPHPPAAFAAFVGSAADLQTLRVAAQASPPGARIAVVLKAGADHLADDCHAAAKGREARIAPLAEWAASGMPHALAAACGHAAESALAPLAPLATTDPLVASLVPDLLGTLTTILQLQGFMLHARPAVVFGAFEKSPLGAALPHVARDHAAPIANLQHGIIPRANVLDLMPFDRFVAWNRDSAQTILADGFHSPRRVRVLGNPAWDDLRAQARSLPETDELARWKAGRPLIVAFTQPDNDVFVAGRVIDELLGLLAQHLAAHTKPLLLVKRHPREPAADLPPCLQTAALAGRARLAAAADTPPARALAAADLVVGVNSTVLLDAAALGKPVLAVDTEGSLDRIPYRLHRVAAVARTRDEALAHLAAWATGARAAAGAPAPAKGSADPRTNDPMCFPVFPNTYADRFTAMLRHLARERAVERVFRRFTATVRR